MTQWQIAKEKAPDAAATAQGAEGKMFWMCSL